MTPTMSATTESALSALSAMRIVIETESGLINIAELHGQSYMWKRGEPRCVSALHHSLTTSNVVIAGFFICRIFCSMAPGVGSA